MKKIILVLLLGCMFLTGCSEKEKLEVTSENILAVSTTIATALKDQDYKTVQSYLSKETKKDVSDEKLKSAWDKLVTDAGAYVSMEAFEFRPDDRDLGIVNYTFENKVIRLSLKYDENMEVKQINLNENHPQIEAITTEDFTETNVKVGYGNMLDGMLTLPNGVENPPVVILLQGSGSSNLNEEIFENKPFEDIAHGLAQQGIASIRYDKRYYAYPAWDGVRSQTVDWEYFIDFSNVVHQLEDMPVNHNQIYLMGHSQGGMLAPRLAYDHPEIKGIISLAGTPRGLEEVIKDQQINALLAQGLKLEDIAGQIKSIDDNIAKIQGLTEETADDYVVWNMPLKYWYQLNQSRAKLFFEDLKCDVLILQGEEDFQVFFDNDYEEWKKLSEGKDNVMMKSYPGLSHLFMPSIEGTTADYQIPAQVDQQVIDDMVKWIQTRELSKGEKK
ncbi:alpha/beta fold hydrolase [Anaerorhabdus sp.]|uniref:alpha/beta fold hydrolase n=1 Tax=Anaerorhabdus sp. TaxID=1872524 RepID=UPI002FCAF7DD